ncbi:arginine--tRNA ligase [soil metagenome]
MQALQHLLSSRLQAASVAALGPDFDDWDPQLRDSTKPEFGHLQTNLPLRLAQATGLPPREIAARILSELDVDGLCLPPQVAGAGFINLTWRADVLADRVNAMLGDDRLGIAAAMPAQRVVIDYSSPNVAKQMHVGHLRSTVIGDALARVLAFAGHEVIAQNHVGDWGTQFGMLIEQLLGEGHDGGDLDLPALDALYRRARARFDADPGFADASRLQVVALQSGVPDTRAVWERLVAVSVTAFGRMYARMGALLTEDDLAGESSYNDVLPTVVQELEDAGLLTESDGAICAFIPGFAARDGAPLPLIVRKSDGGFGYAATDLAAVRHRVGTMRADRLVYVVDARQSLHFDQVLALARAVGWLPDRVAAEHVAFGTVRGEDGKPFKTRSGETIPLSSLLDAAEAKALSYEWGSGLGPTERSQIARAVGIGAVKYADLSSGLGRDYTFALDRMVAMDGNTGPYLQYAHARLCTLLAKASSIAAMSTSVGALEHPAEQRLALVLTGFPRAVDKVAATLEPHHLCPYLYDVAAALSTFYEACPVLKAEEADRATRVALCEATKRVLATGLDLLGIEAPARM